MRRLNRSAMLMMVAVAMCSTMVLGEEQPLEDVQAAIKSADTEMRKTALLAKEFSFMQKTAAGQSMCPAIKKCTKTKTVKYGPVDIGQLDVARCEKGPGMISAKADFCLPGYGDPSFTFKPSDYPKLYSDCGYGEDTFVACFDVYTQQVNSLTGMTRIVHLIATLDPFAEDL